MNTSALQDFHVQVRVYWEDTDAGGVVYHAQYLAFLERARTEWLRAQCLEQTQLRDAHDLLLVVRAMQLDFRASARLDDALSVSVQLRECRRASLVIAQSIHRGDTLLVDASVRVAAVSATSFRPVAIPDDLLAQWKALERPQ